MPEYLRAYAERAASDGGQLGDPIRFIASTENVARDGMVIPASAWQLDNFRKNPVALFAHRYDLPPIGKVTNIEVRDNQLVADVSFDQDDPFAVSCEKKVRNGVMSACSVGWDTLSFEPPNGPNVAPRVTKADLLDWSLVPVPSDPGALAIRQKRGLETMARDILKMIEVDPESVDHIPDDIASHPEFRKSKPETPSDPPPARPTWDATAAEMVRLFQPFGQRPDEERKADYQRLSREYHRHDKVPPEFLASRDLDALGATEIRGLFLAGEPEVLPELFAQMETRAGAVLSQRNRDDLGQAISLIQGVLARAQKESKQDDQQDEERATEAALAQLHAQLMGN